MKKIISTLLMGAAMALTTASVQAEAPAQYGKSCAICHASGTAGAPKTGDAAAWAPRMEKGMDALLNSANNGLNAMPPKGMCFTCSNDDFKALIEYMATVK